MVGATRHELLSHGARQVGTNPPGDSDVSPMCTRSLDVADPSSPNQRPLLQSLCFTVLSTARKL